MTLVRHKFHRRSSTSIFTSEDTLDEEFYDSEHRTVHMADAEFRESTEPSENCWSPSQSFIVVPLHHQAIPGSSCDHSDLQVLCLQGERFQHSGPPFSSSGVRRNSPRMGSSEFVDSTTFSVSSNSGLRKETIERNSASKLEIRRSSFQSVGEPLQVFSVLVSGFFWAFLGEVTH